MKVVILAGGLGTRLAEYTHRIPKPMVEIGGIPILVHIMEFYYSFGHNDFYIALGYKGEMIKDYFKNYKRSDWHINLIDTGQNTLTGGRLKRLEEFLTQETFFLTYGDGLSNVNLDSLLKFHSNSNKLITMSAVRPPARFGELEFSGNEVIGFDEKPQMQRGWINGGFFAVEPGFIKYIDGDNTMLEREPLSMALNNSQMAAYKHEGLWQCMDTKREHEKLISIWESGNAFWKMK